MMSEQFAVNEPLSRRRLWRYGIGAGLGLGIARHGLARSGSAPATPSAVGFSDDYARPNLLVEPAALRERAVVPSPNVRRELPSGSTAKLLTVVLASEDAHVAARLPGAAQIDWPALEVVDTSDASLARWRAELEQIVAGLGITPEDEVVAYDPGTLFAARIWWVLSYLGHERVSLLHGGLPAWDAAGGEIASGPLAAAEVPLAAEPYPSTPRDGMLAPAAQVRSLVGEPAVAMVDARTPEEYAAGHIPGAVNFSYLGNVQPGPPPRWLPAADLLAIYATLSATPDKLIIPYCTSGVRSAVTAFTLHLLGYPNVALYTGSWQEWQTLPDAPITTGDQP